MPAGFIGELCPEKQRRVPEGRSAGSAGKGMNGRRWSGTGQGGAGRVRHVWWRQRGEEVERDKRIH